jgi:hypothetical protein
MVPFEMPSSFATSCALFLLCGRTSNAHLRETRPRDKSPIIWQKLMPRLREEFLEGLAGLKLSDGNSTVIIDRGYLFVAYEGQVV